ncbi:hypothetical protein D3C72_1930240 [compost metagenome]
MYTMYQGTRPPPNSIVKKIRKAKMPRYLKSAREIGYAYREEINTLSSVPITVTKMDTP